MRNEKGQFVKGIHSHSATEFGNGQKLNYKKPEGWRNKTTFRNKPFALLWKTNHAEYTRIHRWIISKKGTPMYCELCKNTEKKEYDWANKSGRYLKNIYDWFRLCKSCHAKYDNRQAKIFKTIQLLTKTFKENKPCLIAGNGGSLMLSEHMACEFVSKLNIERRALPAIALSFPSIISAIANDYSFDDIFSRQVEAFGYWGGVLIIMTTSDVSENRIHSKNLFRAIQKAKEMGLKVVVFGGYQTKTLRGHADILLKVEGEDTPTIQNNHLEIIHIICREVEANIFYDY